MGFLSGRISCERYRVEGSELRGFGPEHLAILEKFAIGHVETSSADGVDVGFLAGAHLFDTVFQLEKNVIGDGLSFAIRIDTNKIPGTLRKAWLAVELALITAENPGRKPTKAQKQEAQDAVEARCEEELKSGKFRRMQQFPLLWDARSSMLYFGGSSPAVAEQCLALLSQAFGIQAARLTSGRLADEWAHRARKRTALADSAPSAFQSADARAEIAWHPQSDSHDYLGNEFLLWLWWSLETQSDTLTLADDSEVAAMLSRTLSLECPLGESGKETITAESPVHLPEARQAIRSGKLPRKAGLTLARYGEQYDLVLQAESFSISGAKLQADESAGKGVLADRLATIRHFSETLDLLFGAFCARRFGQAWTGELDQIRGWLQADVSARRKPAA